MRRVLVLAMPLGFVFLCGCTLLQGMIGEQAPTAALSGAPAVGKAPLRVRFDAGQSTAEIGIVSYAWDYGDGTAEEATGAPIVEHAYDRSGDYIARVRVTDTSGRTAEASLPVTVENTPPYPSCRFSNDAPVVGERVQFDASGSFDLDGDLVDFRWDFGDGETMRGTRVSHVYDEPTVCIVRLEIEDNQGAVSAVVHTLNVHTGSGGGGCGGGGGAICF